MESAGRGGTELDPEVVDQLADATDEAVNHLADVEAQDDLEEFGAMLSRLIETAAALLRTTAGSADIGRRPDLEAAYERFREARDLLDDGEPVSAVAFEVMAARELLRRRPQG